MSTLPSVSFSDQGDILYVTLSDSAIVTTRAYGDDRLVDFDQDGRVVGAEFIGVATSVDLRGLPETNRLRDAVASRSTPRFTVLVDAAEVTQ